MNPRDDDLDWLAALAGRPREGSAPATLHEARLLREAARAWPPEIEAEPAADAETHLLQAAAASGLLRRRWCPGCAQRWRQWRIRLAHPAAWGWAVAATAALLLWLQVPPAPSPEDTAPVLRGAPADGVWLLRDADPRARRDKLAGELEALGATVRRYERLGRFGLDAEWRGAAPPDLAPRLARLGLARTADGGVRVEVEAAR